MSHFPNHDRMISEGWTTKAIISRGNIRERVNELLEIDEGVQSGLYERVEILPFETLVRGSLVTPTEKVDVAYVRLYENAEAKVFMGYIPVTTSDGSEIDAWL